MTIQANFPNVQPSLLLDFANAKQLPPSVNFTRATTAAYYDGNTTALAEQNLLQYSQAMNTSPWDTVVASVTQASGTAPDGTTTANTITQTSTGTARARQTQVFQNGAIHTYSAYIKAGTAGYAAIAYSESSWECYVKVNMSTGAIQEAGNFSGRSTYVSSSITSVGNGWYRVSLVFTAFQGASTDYIHIIVTDSTSWSGQTSPASTTSVGTVLAWGAQVEQRSSATAYTATTTQAITNYIPVLLTAGGGQPRFDHNPTTSESLGLLIEQQSTNLVAYSSDFGSWTKPNSSFSVEAISPDGTLSASKIISTVTGSNSGAYQSSSGANTISLYAKAAGKNWVAFINTSGATFVAWFNVSTGTVGTVSAGYTATMTSVGNGWYRCVLTAASGSFAYHQWCICDQDNDSAVTANAINGVFVWGAQAEAGSFATSYIPTTSAAATRAEDGASMTGINLSSWFNNAQGTLYIDGTRFGTNLYPRFAGFYSGNTENYSMGIGQWSASTVSFYGVNGTTQFDISRAPSGLAYGSQVRAAGAYAVNNVGLSANGTATSVDTDATIPYIDIFWIGGGVNPRLNGWLKKVAYYPVRVTDAQLQALTT